MVTGRRRRRQAARALWRHLKAALRRLPAAPISFGCQAAVELTTAGHPLALLDDAAVFAPRQCRHDRHISTLTATRWIEPVRKELERSWGFHAATHRRRSKSLPQERGIENSLGMEISRAPDAASRVEFRFLNDATCAAFYRNLVGPRR